MKVTFLLIAIIWIGLSSAFKDKNKDHGDKGKKAKDETAAAGRSQCETVFDDVWEEKCTTLYKDKCETEYVNECSVTKTTECTNEYREECSFVFEDKCTDIKIPYCDLVFEEKCHKVKECTDVPNRECSTVPKRVCTEVEVITAINAPLAPEDVVKEEEQQTQVQGIPTEQQVEEEYEVPAVVSGGDDGEELPELPADGYDVREIVKRSIPESWKKAFGGTYDKHTKSQGHNKGHSKGQKDKKYKENGNPFSPVYKTVCSETFEERCFDVVNKDCRDVDKCKKFPKKTCGFTYKNICSKLPANKCVDVPKEVCVDVPQRSCADVPREACLPYPEKSCEKITVKRPREVCYPNKQF